MCLCIFVFAFSEVLDDHPISLQSVFRFYDPDQRGFVSQEDFVKVVSSLPFSCHILEKDQ